MEIINTREVAELLGIRLRTVQRMIVRGELTPMQKLPGPGGAYIFDKTTLPSKEDL